MSLDFYGSPDQIDTLTYEDFLNINKMKQTFFLSKRQPSKKAWMVNVDGFVRFIPKSFPHEIINNVKLIVELPEWFELK